LLRTTPRGHFDYVELQKSIMLIGDVASHLNEQKRQKDSQKSLKQIQRKFQNFITNQSLGTVETSEKVRHTLMRSIIQPHRHLLKEGHLKLNFKGEWMACDIYLFTDILLISNCSDPSHVDEDLEEEEIIRISIHVVFTSISEIEGGYKPLEFLLHSWAHGETFHFQGFEKNELDVKDWKNELNKSREEEYEKLKDSEKLIDEKSIKNLQNLVNEKLKKKEDVSKKVSDYKKLLQAKEEKLKKLNEKIAVYEEKKLIFSQILNLKDDISKAKEFILHCNKRLNKGAIQLSSIISENESNEILLGCLRKDSQSLASYFSDGSNEIDFKSYLEYSEENDEMFKTDVNTMTIEEIKSHYEGEIKKLKSQNSTPNDERLNKLVEENDSIQKENIFLKTQIDELKVVKQSIDEESLKQSEEILKKSELEAKEIIKKAKEKSKSLIEESEKKIREMNQSNIEIETSKVQLEKKKKLLDAADAEAAQILNKADEEAAQILSKAEKDANQILKSAEKESKQIIKNAEKDSKLIHTKAVEDAKQLILDTEEQINEEKEKYHISMEVPIVLTKPDDDEDDGRELRPSTPIPNHVTTPRDSPMLKKIQFFELQKKLSATTASPKVSPMSRNSSFIQVPEKFYTYEEVDKLKKHYESMINLYSIQLQNEREISDRLIKTLDKK
jgi:cell division septum initiation protein DivIVA